MYTLALCLKVRVHELVGVTDQTYPLYLIKQIPMLRLRSTNDRHLGTVKTIETV